MQSKLWISICNLLTNLEPKFSKKFSLSKNQKGLLRIIPEKDLGTREAGIFVEGMNPSIFQGVLSVVGIEECLDQREHLRDQREKLKDLKEDQECL